MQNESAGTARNSTAPPQRKTMRQPIRGLRAHSAQPGRRQVCIAHLCGRSVGGAKGLCRCGPRSDGAPDAFAKKARSKASASMTVASKRPGVTLIQPRSPGRVFRQSATVWHMAVAVSLIIRRAPETARVDISSPGLRHVGASHCETLEG
jgi:hypothetical protein